MSECEYAQKLGAYHDGELPPAQAAEMEEHIASCAACAAELGRIRALSEMLKQVRQPQVPAATLRRLHRRVDSLPNLTIHRLAEIAAAVAAAVLVTCSVLLATASAGTAPAASLPEGWEIAAVPHTAALSAASSDEQLVMWIVQDLAPEKLDD